MSTDNPELDSSNQNTQATPTPASTSDSKKNDKNPMLEYMEMLQPMVDDISGLVNQVVGVNAAKEFLNNLAENNMSLSPMSDTPDTGSILGNAQLDSGPDSSGMESMESSVLESSESLAM